MEATQDLRVPYLLKVMYWVAWAVCIGMLVEAGSLVFALAMTLLKPQMAYNLYPGLNPTGIYELGLGHYIVAMVFMIGIMAIKAYIAYLVVKAIGVINWKNPFTVGVAKILAGINTCLWLTFLVAIPADAHIHWLQNDAGVQGLEQCRQPLNEYFFTAGLVLVTYRIFKRGVEIQTEAELTV